MSVDVLDSQKGLEGASVPHPPVLPSAKALARKVCNTSEETAEFAREYAVDEVDRKAHGKK